MKKDGFLPYRSESQPKPYEPTITPAMKSACAVARIPLRWHTSSQSITALLPKVEVSNTHPWVQPCISPSSVNLERMSEA
jgi:hypothetical protein